LSQLLDTLSKIRQLTWQQVYRDKGLKWEKIFSVRAPQGIDAIYSLRMTQSQRATAFRDGSYMRMLTVARLWRHLMNCAIIAPQQPLTAPHCHVILIRLPKEYPGIRERVDAG
jgi:hypothetical protein